MLLTVIGWRDARPQSDKPGQTQARFRRDSIGRLSDLNERDKKVSQVFSIGVSRQQLT